MARTLRAVCTACGARANVARSETDPATKIPPTQAAIPGKCPQTKDGKHILIWQ